MAVTTSLTNVASGLRTHQDSLDARSRSAANAGTRGASKRSVTLADHDNPTSSHARTLATARAFSESVQSYYTRQVSDTADADIEATYLNRLQVVLGQPGSAGALDTALGNLQEALQRLATGPDNASARAGVVDKAQSMIGTLNRLSSAVQELRQEAEGQIAAGVQNLNGMLTSLHAVNQQMAGTTISGGASGAMLDQRDLLVSGIAELVDVGATYRANGAVALATRSGVGLIGSGTATFTFDAGGTLSASSRFDRDASKSSVGQLTLTTQSGTSVDVVGQGLLQGGTLGGLITLRDRSLVQAQDHYDEIAAGLALAFSTNRLAGRAVVDGEAKGFDVDLGNIQPGNDVLLTYSQAGVDERVRLVNSAEPLDYYDASSQRVIGVDLSGDLAAAAQAIAGKLPGLVVTETKVGKGLRLLDDGQANQIDIKAAEARTTATAPQDAGLGLGLFVDQDKTAFTNRIDGAVPQKRGFAARISLNAAVLADNALLVPYQAGGSPGDADRAQAVLVQLDSMKFASGDGAATPSNGFALTGSLGEIVSQALSFQGYSIQAANARRGDRQLAMETIAGQMASASGVQVDVEVVRLMALENAYAANARVVSTVMELLDTLSAV